MTETLFDLPEEQRREVLLRMGMTEDEYRQHIGAFEKAVAEAPRADTPAESVPDKFKDELVYVVEDE